VLHIIKNQKQEHVEVFMYIQFGFFFTLRSFSDVSANRKFK